MDQCPLRLQAELTARLSRFDILSVREESGVAICQAVGKEAVHVLDPTLLLAKEEYLSLSRDIPPSPSPYIFILVSIFQVMRRYVGRSFEVSQRERDYRWW